MDECGTFSSTTPCLLDERSTVFIHVAFSHGCNLSGHSHFSKRLLFLCGALRVSVRNARARSKGFENSENGVHSIRYVVTSSHIAFVAALQ
jgi:hypothetical protein